MQDLELTKKKALLSKHKYAHIVNDLVACCKITEEELLALDLEKLKVMLCRSSDVVALTENGIPFSFSDLSKLGIIRLNEILDNNDKILRLLRTVSISLFDFLKISAERRALLVEHVYQIDYLMTHCNVSFKDVSEFPTFLLEILIQNARSVSDLVCNTSLTVPTLMKLDLERLNVFLNIATSIRNHHCNKTASVADLKLLAPAQLQAQHGNLAQLQRVIGLTKEAIACLERNSELTGNWPKRDIGFFGWLPCEMRAEALVYSRDPDLITPTDAKEIVLQGMYKST